ncbi:MAG: hypothetical protein WKF81_05125 [Thermomicrobiales bacterium]
MFSRITLRSLLLVDAVLTGATGVLMVGGAWILEDLLDLHANLLWLAGLVLIIYVIGLIAISRQEPVHLVHVEISAGINLLWAVGCLVVAFAGWTGINALGIGFLLLQVMVVGLFGTLQIKAIRKVSHHQRIALTRFT